ncbi:unnamed protein product [Adineta steineri]|uniref:Uncharacterized protein n=2 Tax=Adineta steineri TaxID=433720 RepID=A0A813RXN8_9BILA|nr:unnamed protein product [Adineta steineri]CAF4162872.1 unnamed protein product [Adineta steineri]
MEAKKTDYGYIRSQCKVLSTSINQTECIQQSSRSTYSYSCYKEVTSVEYKTLDNDIQQGIVYSSNGYNHPNIPLTPIGTVATCYYSETSNGILEWEKSKLKRRYRKMMVRAVPLALGVFALIAVLIGRLTRDNDL